MIDILQRYRPDIEQELKISLSGLQSPLYRMMRYHMGWEDSSGDPAAKPAGKFLRPALALLACEALGGEWKRALPAAAAIELVHNFSLIHDDIQDRSDERRHRATVWKIWGEAQAINAGDAMFSIAYLTALRLHSAGVNPHRTLRAIEIIANACVRLCDGQAMDLLFEQRIDITVNDYLKMIEGKTAALFETSLQLGALLGTENEEFVREMGLLGREIGLAFQIRDDLLGIWGKPEETGKSAAEDITRKKKSLPVVCAFEQAAGKEKERLIAIYQQQGITEQEVEWVIQLLQKLNCCRSAFELMEKYSNTALGRISSLDIPENKKEDLRSAATTLLKIP